MNAHRITAGRRWTTLSEVTNPLSAKYCGTSSVRGHLLLIALGTVGLLSAACAPEPTSSSADGQCRADDHCMIVDDGYRCEPGYRWQNPNEHNNFKCVPDESSESSTEESAESTSEETAESSTEETAVVTSEETAESTSEETAESTPEETAESSTEETAESTSEETAESTSEETAESSTEETAESTSEETADVTSEETVECVEDLSDCDGACVDLSTDAEHCGSCSHTCGDNQLCTQGECQANVDDCIVDGCPDGYYCHLGNKTCLPGCGSDEQCGVNERCVPSTHECVCESGTHDCGGECVVDSSVAHCDDNCAPCWQPDLGSAVCTASGCDFVCDNDAMRCGDDCSACPDTAEATAYSCRDDDSCAISACDAGFEVCQGGEACCACSSDERKCAGACTLCPDGADTTKCEDNACVASSCDDGLTLSNGECVQCPNDPGVIEYVTVDDNPCSVSACESGYVRCDDSCCSITIDTVLADGVSDRAVASALRTTDGRLVALATTNGRVKLAISDEDDSLDFSTLTIDGWSNGQGNQVRDIEPALYVGPPSYDRTIVTLHRRRLENGAVGEPDEYRAGALSCRLTNDGVCEDYIFPRGTVEVTASSFGHTSRFAVATGSPSTGDPYWLVTAYGYQTTNQDTAPFVGESGFFTDVVYAPLSTLVFSYQASDVLTAYDVKDIASAFGDQVVVASTSGAHAISTSTGTAEQLFGGDLDDEDEIVRTDIAHREVNGEHIYAAAFDDDYTTWVAVYQDATWSTEWVVPGYAGTIDVEPGGDIHLVVKSYVDESHQAVFYRLDPLSGEWLSEALPILVAEPVNPQFFNSYHQNPLSLTIGNDGKHTLLSVDSDGDIRRLRFFAGAVDNGNGDDVAEGWICAPEWFSDGQCDCGCGVLDSDCASDVVELCSFRSCGWNRVVDPDDTTHCIHAPESWNCDFDLYDDGQCDCGCGAMDADCESATEADECVEQHCGDNGKVFSYDTTECIDIPQGWSCNESIFANGVCNCGCGAPDIDCPDDGELSDCDWSHCGDDGFTDPEDLTACRDMPDEWTCESYRYADGDCDCGCGTMDVDCEEDAAASDCSSSGCDADETVAADDISQCISLPEAWTCNTVLYGDGTHCDCGCGAVDADCPLNTVVEHCDIDHCAAGTFVDVDEVQSCVDTPPVGYTCYPQSYLDGTCDCGCGIPDPDCPIDATIDDCEWPNCLVDEDDVTQCEPPPDSWTCSPWSYGDFICDCGCGAPDTEDDCWLGSTVEDCGHIACDDADNVNPEDLFSMPLSDATPI